MDMVFDRSRTEMQRRCFVPGQDSADEDAEEDKRGGISSGLLDTFDPPGNFGAASLTSKSSVFGGGRRGFFSDSRCETHRK